jgi:hypothetical protein
MRITAAASSVSRVLTLIGCLAASSYVGSSRVALACSCGWAGGFLKVAGNTQLIVTAKVLSYDKNSMHLQVLRTLKGSAASSIRVFGDNGAQCRPYVTTFPIGTTWVFAVSGQRAPEAGEAAPHYQISICGRYYLGLDGETVSGAIQPSAQYDDNQKLPLADLIKKLGSSEPSAMEVRTASDLTAADGKLVTISGTARDAKAGAVILVEQVPIYVDRMDSWPSKDHGRSVRMTGRLIHKKHISDPVAQSGAIAQGAWGDQYVLTDAQPAR